jgi:serine/threonine protein kinase/Tol biopolymer transport system component
MDLMPDSRFGDYEIISLIGQGGMGEVYRAKDTKLGREVAIKILPDTFTHDPERLARFRREAQVLAALNDPHIGAIYGLEEANSTQFLVLELVDGESLDKRIARGPIPVDEALAIATQIVEALEAAHEKGIIHRDLKPANVALTMDSHVKVLDFGLAKAVEPTSGTPSGLTQSPTITSPAMMTGVGVILGTAAYMAPEQAKGRVADKRADIWAFGCVVFEMLTGERAFQGEDVAETLAAVINQEPSLERVPPKVRKLLRSCFEKDPKKRLRDIGDVGRVLEEPAEETTTGPPPSRLAWMLAVAALAAISIAFGVVALRRVPETPTIVAKLSLLPPANGTLVPGLPFPSFAVSPDGRRIAFEAYVEGKRGLWERDLDNPTPRLLAEFESADRPQTPFWAADSRRLAFFRGELKTIDVTGGPAIAVATPSFRLQGTGSWNQDDVILFSPWTSPVLWKVPAAGGSPTPVTELDQSRHETAHVMPWFLPDGRHFLYLALSGVGKTGVYVGDLASRWHKEVLALGTGAIYVHPGYLLYVRDRTLMAQRFDTSRLELTGNAIRVVEPVDVSLNGIMEASLGFFSASQNDILAYTAGGLDENVQLTWFDRAGKPLDTVGKPGNISRFSLSPDGKKVAFSRRDSRTGLSEIWTSDVEPYNESRLTSSGNSDFPVWSRDSARIYFAGNRDGTWKVYEKLANNTNPEQVVEAAFRWPADVTRAGLLAEMPPSGRQVGRDIWLLSLTGDGKSSPYLHSGFFENQPRVSPDDRWLAHQSNASGRADVYVVSFPQPGEERKISIDGGTIPVWSHDGHELFYRAADGNVMAVDAKPATPGGRFEFENRRVLFAARMIRNPNIRFEVSPDGRFLLPAPVEAESSRPMNIVLNWPELLKQE